jgi:hypothetical protein
LNTIRRWLRPTPDPEGEAEAKRISHRRDTVRASQQGGLGQLGSFGNVPPTPDLLDPKNDR